MEDLRFYIIPDLMSWARMDMPVQTPIEYFDELDEAIERFKELRQQPYNEELTMNENTGRPYARLILGFAMKNLPSQLDVLHVRNGIHYLVDDYTRSATMKDNPEVLSALQCVTREVGFDRVVPHLLRKDKDGNERLIAGTDRHISEWSRYSDFEKDLKFIRFPYHNGGLKFMLRDGGRIQMEYPSGANEVRVCQRNGSHHVNVGYRIFHIDEFAELCWQNGFYVRPLITQPDNDLDSVTIYQIVNLRTCDYAFADYDTAKDKMSLADYCCVYHSNLPTDMDLERIYSIFNADNRPCPRTMHSLSMSDIIVVNKGGEEKAYYVDLIGFKEVPEFLEEVHQREAQSHEYEDIGLE